MPKIVKGFRYDHAALRLAAAEAEYTQADIAQRAGVGQNTVARLLNGTGKVSGRKAARICRVLGVKLGEVSVPEGKGVAGAA